MLSTNLKPKDANPPGIFNRLGSLLKRHLQVLGYVLTVILPIIIRTRRRPVLFSRYSGMGDIICTIPATRALLQRHPGHVVIYNCHESFAEIPRLAGLAGIVTNLEPIGLVGYWYAPLLAGYFHFTHGDDLPDSGCQKPMVTEFCKQFNLPSVEEHPELMAPESVRLKVRQVLAACGLSTDSLILIHPGPSWPTREWPAAAWQLLIAELRQRGYHNIGQLGVNQHTHFGQVEIASIPGSQSLINQFSIEECIAAIAQARLFVGIDSGLLHIAAGTRTPSVGIFGMTLPEYRFSETFRRDFVVNRVDCCGCEHRKPRLHWVTGCPNEIKCMKTLSVEPVLRACLAKLSGQ
jgi:ADP-heptose:LPS heptosyltransferase